MGGAWWPTRSSCFTVPVNVRNECLGAENRILRGQIKARLLLSEGEKARLAEIAQRPGPKASEELAAVAKPDTAGLVPKAHRQEIRRIENFAVGRLTVLLPRQFAVVQMAKEKSQLGLRSNRGCLGKSKFPAARSDGGQHSPLAWPLCCFEEKTSCIAAIRLG